MGMALHYREFHKAGKGLGVAIQESMDNFQSSTNPDRETVLDFLVLNQTAYWILDKRKGLC